MSTYADMARERKRARPLYLELRALDIEVRAEGDDDCPAGCRILVSGLRSLSETHADRVKRHVLDNEAGLTKVLLDWWDPDLEAIRQ